MLMRKLGMGIALAIALACSTSNLALARDGGFSLKGGFGSIASEKNSFGGFVFGVGYQIPVSERFSLVPQGEAVTVGKSYNYLDDKVNLTLTNYFYSVGVDYQLGKVGPLYMEIGALLGYDVNTADLRYKSTSLSSYEDLASASESGMAYGFHATGYVGNLGVQIESRTVSKDLDFVGLALVYKFR